MKFTSFVLIVAVTLPFAGCSSSDSPSSGGTCSNATQGAAANLVKTTNTNTVPVYIADASTTGRITDPNLPLVSITLCTPNHTTADQCTVISNILLDTGSFGLRVFASVIPSNVKLVQQTLTVSGQTTNLAQCAEFGIGADWGGVMNGDILIGNQTASNIPLQVINANFATIPSACAQLQPDTDPCTARYNGILGVGPFKEDCGSACVSTNARTNPGTYYACNSSSCGNVTCSGGAGCAISIPLAQQVVNPIASLGAGFNNGVSLTLPSVDAGGASGVQGSMTMGIGTTAGNVAGGSVVVYAADANGLTDGQGIDFLTNFTSNGNTAYGSGGSHAFLDTGSNGFFFPRFGALTACGSQSGFFCPSTTQSYQATILGYSGSPSVAISFFIGNADSLFGTGKTAFSNVGGAIDDVFDWGLPFFYGRMVFVGINGTSSTMNGTPTNGPFWAF